MRPKTLRAKGDKKRRHETREDCSRKEKYMRFAASRRWEMTTQSPKNKGQCSSVGPAQPKRKLRPYLDAKKRFFARKVIVSAVHVLVACHLYHLPLYSFILASHRQLAPPAPSPLANELIHAAAALPVAACECRRCQPVLPASPGPRYVRCRRRHRSRGCINPTIEQTPANATSHAAKYVHPSLNCLPSSPLPPRETSRHFFFDSSSPPPGTEAYHHINFKHIGNFKIQL
jgi:hypothetical protein